MTLNSGTQTAETEHTISFLNDMFPISTTAHRLDAFADYVDVMYHDAHVALYSRI